MFAKRSFKTKNEIEVTFEVDRPGASTAEWVSESTDWEPVQMKRVKRTGPFRLRVRLPKDHHVQFRYLFDGEHWDNDEGADDYWPTDQGVHNSVIFTGA